MSDAQQALRDAQQADDEASAALRFTIACRLSEAWTERHRACPDFTLTCWAGLAGVSLRTLQRILDGHNTSVESLARVAQAVEFPLDDLFRAA